MVVNLFVEKKLGFQGL